MKKILFALSACCLLATTACTDLTEQVYSSLTQSSYNYSSADLQKTVLACYTPLRSYMGHGALWAMDNTTTDMICMPPNSTGWDDGGIYRRMHYHTWNSEQSHIKSAWNATWKGIGLINNALKQVADDQFGAGATLNTAADAELRALRAYYYWQICDNWGDAPLVKEPTQELPEKATRKEIYDFIISELTAVIPSLSDAQGGAAYGTMTKWAAYALLARTYINAGVYTGTPAWDKAEQACDAIISSGKFQLSENFRDNFLASQSAMASNKEIIFTIPFDQSLAGGNYIHQFSWGAPLKKVYNIASTPWGSGSAMAIPQFIDTFDPEDTRIDDSFVHGPQYEYGTTTPVKCIYDTDESGAFPDLNYHKDIKSGNFTMEWEGYRCNKYEVLPGTGGNLDADTPIFRYAEVLLMKAECMLRQNKSGAGAYVSQVRARDFKANPSKATVTDDQLKENTAYKYGYYAEDYGKTMTYGPKDNTPIELGRLFDEYKWEMVWEFGVRSICVRFGDFSTRNWLSHEAKGDYTSLFPIPESAITSNPKLVQNPDYK